MSQTIRVSLPGYNAVSDNDVRHYSLFADADNILIKEQSRGTVTSTTTVAHNLGYYPHFYAYGQLGSGRFQIMTGLNIYGEFRGYVSATNLYLQNVLGPAGADMRYFIFYDDIPT